MKIYNKNIKLNSFTHHNIITLLFCNFFSKNEILYENLYPITCCWSWSIFFTFNSAIIYDKNAYIRIRKKINCSYIEFHIGNLFFF